MQSLRSVLTCELEKQNERKQTVKTSGKQMIEKGHVLCLDVSDDEMETIDRVVLLGSKSITRVVPFLQAEEPWQVELWNYLDFYNKIQLDLHVEDPFAIDANIPKHKGLGTEDSKYELLSDTSEEAESEPQKSMEENEETEADELDLAESSPPEHDSITQQYITSKIEYKRRAQPNYRERIKIYGTNMPVPAHYFEARTGGEPEVTRHVVAVVDSEELEETTKYHTLCILRQADKQVGQVMLWLDHSSSLFRTAPGSSILKNFRSALKYTPKAFTDGLTSEEKYFIAECKDNDFSLEDLSEYHVVYNAFVMFLRHVPSLESVEANTESLMTILEGPNGLVTLTTSTSDDDKDLAGIYDQLGVIVEKASAHRRYIAGQLSLLVEVLVEIIKKNGKLKGKGKAGRVERNLARTVLRDNALQIKEMAKRQLNIDEAMEVDKIKAKPEKERRQWSAEAPFYEVYRCISPNVLLDDTFKIGSIGLQMKELRKVVMTCAQMNVKDKWQEPTKTHYFGCQLMFAKMHQWAIDKEHTSLSLAEFSAEAETICKRLMTDPRINDE